MILKQTAQRLHAGFLQHAFHLLGMLPRRDKHTVVLGNLRTKPQSITNHIGIGNRLKRLCGTDIDIATHRHGMKTCGSGLHDLLIKRYLQGKEILRKSLSAFPTEYGQRCQYLTRRGIGRQAAALSASMQQDTLLTGEPFTKSRTIAMITLRIAKGLLQEPRGSPTRPQLMSDGIIGTEILVTGKSRNIVETAYEIRRQ